MDKWEAAKSGINKPLDSNVTRAGQVEIELDPAPSLPTLYCHATDIHLII